MAIFPKYCEFVRDFNTKRVCVSSIEGTQDTALIANKRSIKSYTYETGVGDPNSELKIITGVNFKFTKRAFLIQGRNNSNDLKNNFDGTGVLGKYQHPFDWTFPGDDPEVVQQLVELNAGRSVAIVETNNQWFKVAGRHAGLVSQTANQETLLADTGGGYRITMLAVAKSYEDYLAVYTGVSPNKVYDYEQSKQLFDSLIVPQWYNIVDVVVGTDTIIELDAVQLPYVQEVIVGTLVEFRNIVGTVGTDVTNGLNGKSFAVTEVLDETRFKIAQNTTGLVYTSGGEAR